MTTAGTEPSKRRAYVTGAAAGLIGKFASMAAGFVGLWLLNRILGKAGYGAYAFVMAGLQLAVVVATFGLERSVLYRLSRLDAPGGRLAGGSYVRWVLGAVAVVGLAIAAGIVWAGRSFAGPAELPELARWWTGLAILVPLIALGQVLSAWHESRRLVARSLLVPRSAEIARVLFLLVAWWISPTPAGVIAAVVLAYLVPLVVWRMLIPRGALARGERPPAEDLSYGAKLMLNALADRGMRRIDLLMIGVLTTGAFVPEYAVAAQVATLAALGNELIGPVFTPRMGRYFADGDRQQFQREYAQNRDLTLALGISCSVVFVWFGRPLLSIFGDYAGAWPILLVLCAGYLAKIGFGANGRYLNMAGRASWSLASTVFVLVAMVALNLLLIPRYGAMGAAFGTAISFTLVNGLVSGVIWHSDRMATVSIPILTVLAAACGLLVLAALGRVAPLPAGLGLAGLWLLLAPRWWPIAGRLARIGLGRIEPVGTGQGSSR